MRAYYSTPRVSGVLKVSFTSKNISLGYTLHKHTSGKTNQPIKDAKVGAIRLMTVKRRRSSG